MRPRIFNDARYFQIIFQTVFLAYGIGCLHWSVDGWLYVTYFITGLATQFICETLFAPAHLVIFSTPWQKKCFAGIPSVCISSLGLCLLLRTNVSGVAVVAAVVSILSKYLLRYRGKNVFNPSALGIVVTVWITGHAWISPGQWGSGMVLVFGVCCFGFIITTRVQKLDISVAFAGTFAALLFARQIIYQGWPMDYFVQSVSTGSLLLFSFFMITDPKTTPNHPAARIIWAVVVAAVTFYLAVFRFMNGAPIFVLVCAQSLVPLLDRVFKAKAFEWQRTAPLSSRTAIVGR